MAKKICAKQNEEKYSVGIKLTSYEIHLHGIKFLSNEFKSTKCQNKEYKEEEIEEK